MNLLQLDQYKYKHYIDILKLYELDENELSKSIAIPYGVRSIEFNKSFYPFEMNSIPVSVTSITFPVELNQVLKKSVIPDSVTRMEFNQFNKPLEGGWLPKSLTYLDLGNSFQQSILPGQLPESTTKLILPDDYRGTIIEGSITSAVKDLDYKFKSNNGKQIVLTSTSIPKSTTSLEFDQLFQQNIKVGDIPHNVTSLKFSSSFGIIKENSLPLSLRTLTFRSNQTIVFTENVLPPNLTFVNMGEYNHQLTPNVFPRSVETILLNFYNQTIPVGYFYNYSNLTTLNLGKFNQNEIPLRTLPKSLTSLNVLYYEGSIDAITELKSLSTLYLGQKREIIANQLPQSISALALVTSLPIGPNLLPSNLKTLIIPHPLYNHDISVDGYLPASLESVIISHVSYNLINCLNTDFFSKYIKILNNNNPTNKHT